MNKRTIPFIICYASMLIVVGIMLLFYKKAELHLLLNSWHTYPFDTFFVYFTILAEWPLYVIGLLPLFFKRYDWVKFYAICELSGAAIVTILKYCFNSPRPITYFKGIKGVVLPLADDPDNCHRFYSFPSGHACTFFVFVTVFNLLLIHSKWGERHRALVITSSILLILIAALGAYSRVYLSQHFISDIASGSMVGIIVPCLIYHFFGKKIIKK